MDTYDKEKIKIVNKSDKYLTMVDNEPKMKSKLFSKNQNVSYNVQGELIINDSCLTAKQNNDVKFDKCSKTKDQMWSLDNNKIYPDSAQNMCLFTNNEKLGLKKCQEDDQNGSDDNIKMSIEDSDTEKTSDYRMKEYKGKTIVLVESDNPWYLNKDTTIPMKYNKKLNLTTKQYRNNADFGSYTNSEFEHFEPENNSENYNDSISQNYVIFLLLALAIFLYIYKKIKKDGNKN